MQESLPRSYGIIHSRRVTVSLGLLPASTSRRAILGFKPPASATPTRNPRDSVTRQRSHADTQPSDSVTRQRSHADTQPSDSVSCQRSHADTQRSDSVSCQRSHADTQPSNSVSCQRSHADTQRSNSVSCQRSHANTQPSNSVSCQRSHADTADALPKSATLSHQQDKQRFAPPLAANFDRGSPFPTVSSKKHFDALAQAYSTTVPSMRAVCRAPS